MRIGMAAFKLRSIDARSLSPSSGVMSCQRGASLTSFVSKSMVDTQCLSAQVRFIARKVNNDRTIRAFRTVTLSEPVIAGWHTCVLVLEDGALRFARH